MAKKSQLSEDRLTVRMRYGARALVIIWAAWWLYVILFLSQPYVQGSAAITVGLSLALLVSAFISWRWEGIGGAVLIGESLVAAIAFSVSARNSAALATVIQGLLSIALPPLVAGVLFLICWNRTRAMPYKKR